MARITNKVTLLRRPQDGIQGSRGPALRGPMEWDACLPNFQFQCGAQGEPFYDIVYHDKYFYVCKVSHSKSSDSQPGPSSDYWDLFADIPFIATRILLTQYALVKNLGVECIDMKDADGNILFQAKDGNVTCRTGKFVGITVQNAEIESGHIAGFKVSGTGLTNEPFTNDAYVIFRNAEHKCFAGIGGNILPASSGARAVARFENNDTADQWGLGRNIAMLLSAENGNFNHAFLGTGNGTLDGWIGGHKFSKFLLTKSNTIYDGFVTLRDNNRWIICAPGTIKGSGIVLPTLNEVQQALSIAADKSFCVEFTIVADLNSNDFYVYGRNALKDGSNATPWNTDQIPVLTHWTNGRDDRIVMGAANSETFLLVYDQSQTGTFDGYSLKYTARRINHQA